jgi:hypothetical protein
MLVFKRTRGLFSRFLVYVSREEELYALCNSSDVSKARNSSLDHRSSLFTRDVVQHFVFIDFASF